MLLAGSTR